MAEAVAAAGGMTVHLWEIQAVDLTLPSLELPGMGETQETQEEHQRPVPARDWLTVAGVAETGNQVPEQQEEREESPAAVAVGRAPERQGPQWAALALVAKSL
jgi:hypothetical protein